MAYNATVAYKALVWVGVIASLAFIRGTVGRPPTPKVLLAFAVMAGVFTVAAVGSPATPVSMLRLDMYLSIFIFGFVLSHALYRPDRLTMILLLLALAMLHAPLLAIALVAATSHPVSTPFVPPYFSNVRHLGYLGFVAAAASLALALLHQRLRAVALLLTAYALFGLVTLGSRGGLVAWLISAVVLAHLSGSRGIVIRLALLSLGLAFGASYIAEVNEIFRVAGMFDRDLLTDGITSVSVGRPAVWLESWQSFLARPLLGYGPEGYVIAGVTQGKYVQPHNLILQVLLESGLVGLLASVAFGWITLLPRIRAALLECRQRTLTNEEAGLIAIVTGFFAFGMIDGVFYHAMPLLCFAVVVASWFAMRPLR